MEVRATILAVLLLVAGCGGRTLPAAPSGCTSNGQPVECIAQPRQHLPSKCRKYIGDGTENWINCMGVEYR